MARAKGPHHASLLPQHSSRSAPTPPTGRLNPDLDAKPDALPMAYKARRTALIPIAITMVLTMTTWFSATALLTQLRLRWELSSATASWRTVAVQLGFVDVASRRSRRHGRRADHRASTPPRREPSRVGRLAERGRDGIDGIFGRQRARQVVGTGRALSIPADHI